MSQNEGEVYFRIMGENFDPNDITKLVGIEPTRTRIKSEPTPKFTTWEFSSGKFAGEVIDIYEISSSLIAKLKPKLPEFTEIINKNNLRAELQVVLWISTNETISTPAIGFEKDTISFLNQLGASIDIDTYRN